MNTPSTFPGTSGAPVRLPSAGEVDAEARHGRFRAHLVGGEPTGLEWGLGALKSAFGLWLILPTHLFATSAHLYRLVAVVPEWVWGLGFFTFGAVQLVSWWYVWQKARFYTGAIAFGLWMLYGVSLWRADHRSASLVFLAVIAAMQLMAAMWLYGKAFPSAFDRSKGYDRF